MSVGTNLPASISLSAVDRIVDEGEGFERLERDSGSWVHSMIRFNRPCGHQVLATEWSSESPGRGIYLAEMQMDGMFLRYSHGAESHADHLRFANSEYAWVHGATLPAADAGCLEGARLGMRHLGRRRGPEEGVSWMGVGSGE